MKLVRKRLPYLDIIANPIGIVIASRGDNILVRRRGIRWTLVEGPGQGKDSFSIFKVHETIAKYIRVYKTWVGMHALLDREIPGLMIRSV